MWCVGFVAADGTDCRTGPRGIIVTGLDVPRTAWPPGVECREHDESGSARRYVKETIPGSTWIIIGLAGAAGLILLTGVFAGIRDSRAGVIATLTSQDSP